MLRPHPQYPHFNTGRKGSLIYYSWHDIPCVRSYTKPRNPRTPKQQANRTLHAQLTRISGQTKIFRQFCFSHFETYRSSHTAFIGTQLCQINRAKGKSKKPLETKIHWGHGSLPGAGKVGFSWKETPILSWDNSQKDPSQKRGSQNMVLWITWNVTRKAWTWSLHAGKRRDGSCKLTVPKEWRGEELYIWLLFFDPENRCFSPDTCLHIKEYEGTAHSQIKSTDLFTRHGFSYEQLILHWITYRSLVDWNRRYYKNQWLT